MNPLFILFVILGAVAAWFLMSFSFNFLGDIINTFKNDAKNAMFEKGDYDEDEEEN